MFRTFNTLSFLQESNRVVKSTKQGKVLQELWVKGSRPEVSRSQRLRRTLVLLVGGIAAEHAAVELGLYHASMLIIWILLMARPQNTCALCVTAVKTHHLCLLAIMAQGLAFTPDGSKMFVISEPNEMAIYEPDRCSGSHNQPL